MRIIYAALVAVLLIGGGSANVRADGVLRMVSSHWLDYTSTARATTVAFGPQIRLVDLICTTNCYVAVASSGFAQTVTARQVTAMYLPADTPRRFKVSPNSTVVVIRVTADGLLTVMEMTK